MNRRAHLARLARHVPARAATDPLEDAPARPYVYGAQSYSFRKFSLEDAIRMLGELGLDHMEFCAIHFPCDAAHPGFDEVRSTIRAAGVQVPCFGVERFTADHDDNRRKFELAKALGAGILTADPEPESLASLEALCADYDIRVAIHNHGPGARYDGVADTLRAVEGRSPYLGACVDTGHALRSGQAPEEVIAELGARVLCLHLKDWSAQSNRETAVGEGDMNLEAVARNLHATGFAGPIMLEYEEDPDSPVAGMAHGLAAWRTAVCAVG